MQLWINTRNAMKIGAIAVLIGFNATSSLAQTTSSSSDPGRVEERIDQHDKIEKRRESPVDVLSKDAEDAPVTESLETTRFVLSAVTFSENTQFKASEFARFYEHLLARQIGLSDVRDIAAKVTTFYREKGYFLAQAVVESQNLEFGVMHLRVVEGKIAEVRFENATKKQSSLLSPFGLKITESPGPANVNTLERYLLLMNDLPGIDAKANVDPVDRENGVFALNIKVKKKQLRYSVSVDNRGTRAIGRDEAYAAVTANGWITGRESTRLGVFTIPSSPTELAYVELNQNWALGTEGTTVSVSGSFSKIDAGAEEEDNDLNSQSVRGNLQIRHPYIRSRDENLNFYGNFGVSRQKQRDFGAFDYEDRLQALRTGVEYSLEDDSRGFNYTNIWVSRGLGLNDVSSDAPLRSRAGGRPIFTKVYGRAERRQLLTDNWAVKVSMSGQVADQRLLSSEEFSLGGFQFGRGYDGGEISGTHGAAGSIELQFGDDVELGILTSYQFYGFYDGGAVWETAENSYASGHETLASTGLGLRVGLSNTFNGGIELAKPLTRPAEGVGGDGKGPRLFMFLNGDF